MEFWANQNKIDSLDSLHLMAELPELECVYFSHNPIYNSDGFEDFLRSLMPKLKQIDHNILRDKPTTTFVKPIVKSLMKKEMNPDAKEILDSVVASQN
jgi:hypothetical protein